MNARHPVVSIKRVSCSKMAALTNVISLNKKHTKGGTANVKWRE